MMGKVGSNLCRGRFSMQVDLMLLFPFLCDQPIRSVSFLKGGYIELPPRSLSPESEFLATFATTNSSGIILAALSKHGEKEGHRQAHGPFFSIMLIEGHVEVHVDSGDGTGLRRALLRAPTGTFGDGQGHSISLIRSGRIITVQLDEKTPVEMKLGPAVESMTINVSNLYIGGVPEDAGSSMLRMRRSFHGCIRNLIFNMELLDFTSAVGSEQVDLDTCLLSERSKLALHGEDGKLLPEPQPLPSPVKTEYFKRKGFIMVDGQESPMVTIVGDGTTLDVEGKLYLGGLPSDYRARNIGNVSSVFCMGLILLWLCLFNRGTPVSAFAVARCYAEAQEGTFFEGSGYAALVKEGYKVRSDVNITLEFRTSSENGVLLGISSAKVDAIGLEMVNGKLLFHVNNGAGRITATYEPKATNTLCDGKWHTLQANKSKHRVVLIVDGNAVLAESPHTQSTSVDTNNPIYVGGYPADVKQNCLSSQRSFRGCLRKLTLSKGLQVQSYDFSRAFDLQGVVPHSCPGAEP
ncbi:Laminin subunit alpha-1 [Pteropus alecto]|uniref:Laminin subunit alpha-1 n=1 Tax=Pteropus alecto TaxID=9402 RepID=L5K5I3_PTEAL|nr:Laminin subunit alpha-1 [Pteropus alecto]